MHLIQFKVVLYEAYRFILKYKWPVAYRGGVLGVNPPPPQIPKDLQNRAEVYPIVKTVKIC